LLRHAKGAFLQTGAVADLRALAVASHRGMSRLGKGAVPMDSMLVGFSTSLAPWNNVLKTLAIPLIKAQFHLFANFYGPSADGVRLCISARTTMDSKYGNHEWNTMGGVSVFAGPGKWDNVPGWSFGAGGGYDGVKYLDAADFGWDWTLAREPETVCFHFDICAVDAETLNTKVEGFDWGTRRFWSLLQTESEARSERSGFPSHGSTWVGHTWCDPDWENTPLVLEGEPVYKKADGTTTPNPADEWDPQPES